MMTSYVLIHVTLFFSQKFLFYGFHRLPQFQFMARQPSRRRLASLLSSKWLPMLVGAFLVVALLSLVTTAEAATCANVATVGGVTYAMYP